MQPPRKKPRKLWFRIPGTKAFVAYMMSLQNFSLKKGGSGMSGAASAVVSGRR